MIDTGLSFSTTVITIIFLILIDYFGGILILLSIHFAFKAMLFTFGAIAVNYYYETKHL